MSDTEMMRLGALLQQARRELEAKSSESFEAALESRAQLRAENERLGERVRELEGRDG